MSGFSHHSARTAAQSLSWNAANNAAASGRYTASHVPHTGRHHARAIWNPRSSDSQPPRGRSSTLSRSNCTAAPSEQEVAEDDAPQDRPDHVLGDRREGGERRPEGLDERG